MRVQLGMREFYRRAAIADVTSETLPLLVRAADADPGDVDAQRLLLFYGSKFLSKSPQAGEPLRAPVERARERLALLAPHSR